MEAIDTAAEYPLLTWEAALDLGHEKEWCPTDTREGASGHTGALGGWLADEIIGWDMKADGVNPHCDHVTSGMVEAAVRLLWEQGVRSFSPDRLKAVITSYLGETVDDFKDLAEKYAEDNCIELVFLGAEPNEHDYQNWYMGRAVNTGEVYAPVGDGGFLHWFDTSKWG